MRIAVVGCGAVGSYYGGKLCQVGHEVHFLLRSDYEAVRRDGLQVQSVHGDFHVRPFCARTPEEIGVSDVVLVALKTTANQQLPRLLPPLVGSASAVVTLQNGLGNEEQLGRLYPVSQILGGLCFVCLNRVAPGRIHHIDHGRIVLGEYQRPATARTHELTAMFRDAGVPCDVTEDLARTHWEKLMWNIPFNGLGVAGSVGYEAVCRGTIPVGAKPGACLATDTLLGDVRWERLVRGLMDEVMAAAGAMGFRIAPEFANLQIERTRTMGAYLASTLLDFARGQPLELDSLFLEPLRQARRAGVRTPLLEKLCAVLSRLDPVKRDP